VSQILINEPRLLGSNISVAVDFRVLISLTGEQFHGRGQAGVRSDAISDSWAHDGKGAGTPQVIPMLYIEGSDVVKQFDKIHASVLDGFAAI